MVESYELSFIDYVAKINEKLTFARIKMNDGKDISEDEEHLLKELYRIYYDGRYTLCGSKLIVPHDVGFQHRIYYDGRYTPPGSKPIASDDMACQQGLFSDKNTDKSGGTKVDSSQKNQNNK